MSVHPSRYRRRVPMPLEGDCVYEITASHDGRYFPDCITHKRCIGHACSERSAQSMIEQHTGCVDWVPEPT